MNTIRDWSPRLMLMGGGLFAALFTLFSLETGGVMPGGSTFFDDHHWFAHLCEAIAMGPLAVGIAGIYRRYRDRLGRLGRIGAYVAAGGIGIEALAGVFIAVVEPITGLDTMQGILQGITHGPGVLGNFLGGLLFGIAAVRNDALPRAGAAPFMALTVVAILTMFAPIGEAPRLFLPALIALGWAWLGLVILKEHPRYQGQHAGAAPLEYSYD